MKNIETKNNSLGLLFVLHFSFMSMDGRYFAKSQEGGAIFIFHFSFALS